MITIKLFKFLSIALVIATSVYPMVYVIASPADVYSSVSTVKVFTNAQAYRDNNDNIPLGTLVVLMDESGGLFKQVADSDYADE